jgi:hypothetical protein
LIQVWGFDAERAVGLITWLIGLVKDAIKNGKHPGADL